MNETTKQLDGKKVLILYTAHTSGHARIAENIGYWLKQAGAQVVLREVLKSNPSPLVKNFLRLHVWVNVHIPQLWNFLYRYGFWVAMMPWRLPVAWLNRGEIERVVREVDPDLVITTQTSPSAVMSVLKRSGVYRGQWGVAFSDYHFHRAWVYPRADFYLTNIPEQATRLQVYGVKRADIFQIGFALPPRADVHTETVRAKLGLNAQSMVILVGSGSLGVRLPEAIFSTCEQLVSLYAKRKIACSVIVACGRNEVLRQELAARSAAGASWLVPLGYYEPMAELYAVAHVFITKPGGLSIVEAAHWELPTVVTHTLPGQEDLNVAYLNDRGFIVDLTRTNADEWPSIVTRLLDGQGKNQARMPESIRSCGHSFGAWIASRL